MAAKKKSKKKRTPAQIAATKRLVALNKKKGKKKSKKKVAKKRKAKKAPKKKAAKKTRRKAARKVVRKVVRKAAPKKASKKRAKKASKRTVKKAASKGARSVSVKDIIGGKTFKGKVPKNVSAVWICGGPKRTGCGGGKAKLKGSRVLGVLR